MADYSKAFSPSFAANTFTQTTIPGIDYKAGGNLDLSNINFDKLSSISFNPASFTPGLDLLGGGQAGGWTFITAPEDVSWDVANQATRVDIFGTNNPPVVAGSRGMRDLTLSNSLVEGFQRNKSVEAKVASLEALMNYGLNTSDGFVSVPVYQVWANSKSYGGPEAYYIIKDIKVKETMRDIQGQSTRAYVDISLMQVPAYQVNSGRDQASQSTAGAGKVLQDQAAAAAAKGTNGTTAAAAAATAAGQGVGSPAKPSAGANAPSPAPAPSAAPAVIDPSQRRSIQPAPR